MYVCWDLRLKTADTIQYLFYLRQPLEGYARWGPMIQSVTLFTYSLNSKRRIMSSLLLCGCDTFNIFNLRGSASLQARTRGTTYYSCTIIVYLIP
jgi:hypothetical protein